MKRYFNKTPKLKHQSILSEMPFEDLLQEAFILFARQKVTQRRNKWYATKKLPDTAARTSAYNTPVCPPFLLNFPTKIKKFTEVYQ